MLDKNIINDMLNEAISHGGDFAEIFVEHKKSNNISMTDKKIESAASAIEFGVGIRVFNGYSYIYSYTNDLSKESLLNVAKKAGLAAKENKINKEFNLINKNIKQLHQLKLNPTEINKTVKVDLIKRASTAAYNYHNHISMVDVTYLDYEQNVQIANTENLYCEDKRIRTRLSINSIATRDEKKENGYSNSGLHGGFEHYNNINIEDLASEASKTAINMLDADYAPSGKMPVIMNNGFGGVIFHEACGHGLEAASVAKNTSVFADKMGEKIASDLVTYIDDGTIENAWGSLNVDDEGIETQKNTLIKEGILTGYMIDKLNSRRMNMKPTGSSRRQSYKLAPTSRMTNTYIANGKSTVEDIISNTEHALFAKKMSGGQVNTATGDFNFAIAEGFMVENGKITKPVKGALLIGNGPKILTKIDMVANDLVHGQGMCGASSGSVPVNVGQPTLRVSEILVGGRK